MSVINDCAVRLLNACCSAHPISSGNLLFFQIFLSFFLLLLLFSFNAFFTRFRCFVVVIVLFPLGLYRCQLGLSVVCSSFSPALFIYSCAFDMRRKECTQKRSVAGCVFGVTQNANQDVRDDALPCHAMPCHRLVLRHFHDAHTELNYSRYFRRSHFYLASIFSLVMLPFECI